MVWPVYASIVRSIGANWIAFPLCQRKVERPTFLLSAMETAETEDAGQRFCKRLAKERADEQET